MHFEVYGKDDCSYCKRAVSLLTAKNLSFDYKKLGEHFTREELLQEFPSAKTFPQVRETNGKIGPAMNIGGYDDLVLYLTTLGI